MTVGLVLVWLLGACGGDVSSPADATTTDRSADTLDDGSLDASPNTAPVAMFTLNQAVASVTTVDFDASSSNDPDGSIVEYRWDFGDGQSGSGETSSHNYAQGLLRGSTNRHR